MVTQYIATQPILDLCEQSTLRPGVRVSQQWWEQAGLDLEGGEEKGGRSSGRFGRRGVDRRGVGNAPIMMTGWY